MARTLAEDRLKHEVHYLRGRGRQGYAEIVGGSPTILDRNTVGSTDAWGTAATPSVAGSGIHNKAGNLGLGDGSVQQVTDKGLQRQIDSHVESGGQIRLIYP